MMKDGLLFDETVPLAWFKGQNAGFVVRCKILKVVRPYKPVTVVMGC